VILIGGPCDGQTIEDDLTGMAAIDAEVIDWEGVSLARYLIDTGRTTASYKSIRRVWPDPQEATP